MRRTRLPGWIAVLHPFPSLLNAAVVVGLATVAGADGVRAAGLGLAMLALQFCIGASNDLADAERDARVKPAKPLPAGRISRRTATALAVGSGIGAVTLAAAYGPVIAALAAAMLGAGLAYNLLFSRGPLAWVPYAVALPLLPVYAWWGAVAHLPPRFELLIPVAALAGPALHLANGVVDLERDRAAGRRSLAVLLGRRRSVAAAGMLQALIHVIAWIGLALHGVAPRNEVLLLLVLAAALAVIGLVLAVRSDEPVREHGWQAQAASIGLLAVGWLAAASAS